MEGDGPQSTLRQRAYRRRYLRIAAISGILILPFIMLLLFSLTRAKFTRLPVYFPLDIKAPGDTVFHTLPDFGQFHSQSGHPFTLDSLRGKIHVANFIFTTCPGICPKLTANMQEVQSKMLDPSHIVLVSYSIDPGNDSVPALKAYADKKGAKLGFWYLLTGSDTATYKLIREGYKLNAGRDPKAPENGLFHDDKFVLVDPDLRIRGYYKGLSDSQGQDEIRRLVDEMKVLALEYKDRWKQDKAKH